MYLSNRINAVLHVVGTPDVPKQSKDLKDKFSNLILLHTAKNIH